MFTLFSSPAFPLHGLSAFTGLWSLFYGVSGSRLRKIKLPKSSNTIAEGAMKVGDMIRARFRFADGDGWVGPMLVIDSYQTPADELFVALYKGTTVIVDEIVGLRDIEVINEN